MNTPMNPLSSWTFHRRHKKRTFLLVSLISLVTVGLYLVAALTWTIFTEPIRTNYMFLSKINIVTPFFGAGEIEPAAIARIRTHPAVSKVIPVSVSLGIGIPEPIGGQNSWMSLLALQEEDIPGILAQYNTTLIAGSMLSPRTNGILFSEKAANALDLEVGDVIYNGADPERYYSIIEPMTVVGILSGDVRLGIISYEYIYNHEQYRINTIPQFIVTAKPGFEQIVDEFLLNEIQSNRINTWTFTELRADVAREYQRTYPLGIMITFSMALAVTFVIGVINQIALLQRLPEYGILNAAGYSRRWLTRRLTMETTALTLVGWGIGILLSWLLLYILKWTFFQPNGHDLIVISLGINTLAPLSLVVFIPLAVIITTNLGARRIFARLDTVAIVEQGELESEPTSRPTAAGSPEKPLSSLTYSRRHKTRTMLVGGAMSLVIIATALIFFIFAAVFDANQPTLGELRHMSMLQPLPGTELDPAVAAQVRTHPEVLRTIPYVKYSIIDMVIPPFSGAGIDMYALYTNDLSYLVDLYGLELKSGTLPQPYTNQVVIPEAAARNRGLSVGDIIGNPDAPAYPGAPSLPTEFVISGIFAQGAAGEENWLGFLSLEFRENHEAFDMSSGLVYPLMVVPKPGQQQAVDTWLENEVAGNGVEVLTYQKQVQKQAAQMRNLLVTIGLLEAVITIVTAIALAALNFIFVSQRQTELGVLNALGYSRWQLVKRMLQEMTFTTGIAWGSSLLLCLTAMLLFQVSIFSPLGLRLNLVNPIPWLFTLPVPLAVLAAGSFTTARILSRVDPVAVIERRG